MSDFCLHGRVSCSLLPFVLVGLLSGFAAAQTPKAELEQLATSLFTDLGVKPVTCPPYTAEGGNLPACGLTELTPEAYTAAFSHAAQGQLEPQDHWAEDHTVWLRHYRQGSATYAAIYTALGQTFNVQLIRLGGE